MRYTRLHGFRDGSLGPAMWKMTRRSGKAGDRLADGLSDAELQVFHAFPTGSLVKLGSGDAEDDPPHQEGWGPGQLVRAAFLVSLLCGAVEVEPGLVGAVNIEGACVIGELGFPQVTFKHRLRLHDCYVPDGINLEEATTRTLLLDGCDVAAIYLLGAKIDGSLVLSGAHVGGRDRHAIAADRLAITGNVWCDKGFQASGGIGLAGASIGGQLVFRGARLDGNGKPALTADGLKVTDAMFCDEGFQACGEVRLVGTRIGGQLHLDAARLDGNGEPALTADGLIVTDAMFCRQGFEADGQIRISDARIGGELNLSRARLDGKGRPALTADRTRVTGNMLCSEGFQASGEVRLAGSSIGSQLNFGGAHLDGKSGNALTAEWLSVTGNMYCNEGFRALGEVNLSSADIGGQLIFSGAHLDGKGEPVLYAQGLTVTRGMFLDEGFRADGAVNLTGAKIGSLVDEVGSWPQALNLDGLTYDDLTNMPARKRLDWLDRSVDYAPQPYEQLAAHYRRLGHDEEARRVLLAKLRQRRRQRPWWARWWGWLQDLLAGYGYAPGRAVLLLAGAFVAGWLVFSTRHPVPVGPGPSPEFNAPLYTLDVLIPAPALGQASDFDPQGATLAVAVGLHILGWLLAITVIAAITRSFSRS
jgi:hypothetical protein